MTKILIAGLSMGLLLSAGTAPAGEHDVDFDAGAIRAHVTFLADDLLEGRGSGTRGYDIAARYVASWFANLGLEPAGDGDSYFQAFTTVEEVLVPGSASVSVRKEGRTRRLESPGHYMIGGSYVDADNDVTAPASGRWPSAQNFARYASRMSSAVSRNQGPYASSIATASADPGTAKVKAATVPSGLVRRRRSTTTSNAARPSTMVAAPADKRTLFPSARQVPALQASPKFAVVRFAGVGDSPTARVNAASTRAIIASCSAPTAKSCARLAL